MKDYLTLYTLGTHCICCSRMVQLVKMTRTLNRLWLLITGQFYIREMISEPLVSVCLIEGDRLIQVWLYYVYGICLTDSILPYVFSVIVTMTPTLLVDHINFKGPSRAANRHRRQKGLQL